MARLGVFEEWLDSTARGGEPAVSLARASRFSTKSASCAARTIWPPQSPSLMGARVRWKSARFVPSPWCSRWWRASGRMRTPGAWMAQRMPGAAGRLGPFRTAVRFSAAVDRLSGSSERHSIACLEFRAGAGLWLVAAFHDEPAWSRWRDPSRRLPLLADSGFGGERSRGWAAPKPRVYRRHSTGTDPPPVAQDRGTPVETAPQPRKVGRRYRLPTAGIAHTRARRSE